MNEETAPAPVKAELVSDDTGLLRPRNIEEAFRLAKAYASSRFLPDRYTSPEMVLTAMQYAIELGLKPLTALRQIAVVKGTPTVFGDLPLALCYASKKIEWIKEAHIDASGVEISPANKNLGAEAYAAICRVKRRDDPEIAETFFTMDDARQANLNNIKAEAWNKYPKIMLKYRARSAALKQKFPDVLNGIAIGEYDFHETIDTVTVDRTPKKTLDDVLSSPQAEVYDA